MLADIDLTKVLSNNDLASMSDAYNISDVHKVFDAVLNALKMDILAQSGFVEQMLADIDLTNILNDNILSNNDLASMSDAHKVAGINKVFGNYSGIADGAQKSITILTSL